MVSGHVFMSACRMQHRSTDGCLTKNGAYCGKHKNALMARWIYGEIPASSLRGQKINHDFRSATVTTLIPNVSCSLPLTKSKGSSNPCSKEMRTGVENYSHSPLVAGAG